ncbi:MAG: rare lipoprotein A [Verrucomicrobiales bacterium]|jgi:rare lipoprotein A
MKVNRCALGFLTIVTLAAGVSCGTGNYEGYKNAPYTVRGVRYYPMSVEQALGFRESGVASWYDERKLFGLVSGTTALGEDFRAHALAGAHRTLPLPCQIKVTNLENGKTAKLRLNDRGPYIGNRMLDVSPRAASKLGFKDRGLTRVQIEVLSVGDGRSKRKR